MFLVKFLIIIIYGQLLALGFEVYYDEKNKKNKDKDNIFDALLSVFALNLFFSIFSISECHKIIRALIRDYDDKFDIIPIILVYTSLIIFFKILFSFGYSFILLSGKEISLKLDITYFILNKYIIFVLSYFSIKLDLENEIISNSSLISVYLYTTEIIFSEIKN